jgi:gamma-butyrobetaine dioxygenase
MADHLAGLRRDLAGRGFALLPAGLPGLGPEEAARAPWIFAERLLGERPRLVERQPIKAVPGGRSFASSSGPTPLHTDSQAFAGAPPAVQVMACVRPAGQGGACVLADTRALLDRLAASDPDLHHLLFSAPRRIPFVFGDVHGPTVTRRAGALVFTHSPVVLPGDPVAARLAPWIEAAPRIEVSPAAGEILVVDNHRMLHGRHGFAGTGREFVRLLVWTAPADEPPSARRLGVVLEMLRGVPPGVLAAREGIPEPDLYRMRDAALAAAEEALLAADGALPAGDDVLAGRRRR